MNGFIDYLLEHDEAILFWVVFVEQLGLPIPAVPVLIAAGALVAAGKMGLPAAVGLPVLASMGPDLLWYWLGKTRGGKILGVLCRISLEPDSCVRRTENAFVRYGVGSLLVAKFVPGLSTVTPPLAGIVGMTLTRFLFYDAVGAFLWAGSSAALGYAFSEQLERLVLFLSQTGWLLAVLVVGGVAGFVGVKYVQRRRFLRQLSMAKITVEELKQRLDAGEPVVILDVRHPLDLEVNPQVIPGSLPMHFEEVAQRHHEIPRDREIVLYCSCPNEVTSARTALLLKRHGVTRVRPLVGGIEAWRDRNYPLEVRPVPAEKTVKGSVDIAADVG
jgi:membrane protein DedA with SNARE-associated domain/rhodanese-related sulfurtransferase